MLSATARSMLATFYPLLTRPILPLVRILESVTFSKTRCLWPTWRIIYKHIFKDDLLASPWLRKPNKNQLPHAKEAFRKHYAEVEAATPPERLLKYHVSEGWGSLCKFLGQPVPCMPYPSGNSCDSFRKRFDAAIYYGVRDTILRVVRAASLLALALFVCNYWRRARQSRTLPSARIPLDQGSPICVWPSEGLGEQWVDDRWISIGTM